MVAAQSPSALAARSDGQAAVAANVPRLCADVRAGPRVGAAAGLAASIPGTSLEPVALCVGPLSGEGGGDARGRRATRREDRVMRVARATWFLCYETVNEWVGD